MLSRSTAGKGVLSKGQSPPLPWPSEITGIKGHKTWASFSVVSGTFLQALFEAVARDGAGNPGDTQKQVLAPQACPTAAPHTGRSGDCGHPQEHRRGC